MMTLYISLENCRLDFLIIVIKLSNVIKDRHTYNIDAIRHSVYLAVNPITVDHFAYFYYSTLVQAL